MIKYLGSKRLLVPTIGRLLRASEARSALDLFTGTTRVAQEFCRQGAFTHAVDSATYSEILAQCYVETDATEVDQYSVEQALQHLRSLPPRRGYFTEVFCEQSRYFHPDNGRRIDAIRDGIEEHYAGSSLYPILLTSLLLAADAVDSTVGLQMAYLKQWASRSLRPLRLLPPTLTPGTGVALRGDATEVVSELPHVDFAYLDPPYNQHQYFANYHVWETLVRWDAPDYYGVACKRIDARDQGNKSVFNQRRHVHGALRKLLLDVRADVIALSFSNEGFIQLEDLVEMCQARGGTVKVLKFDNNRHVGARIGIHNSKGQRTGRISHTRNTEYILLQGETERVEAMSAAAGQDRAEVNPRSGTQLP